jgi:SM-20-related protein
MELPEILPAQCVVLDEFLAPAEVFALAQYTLERESEFELSEVVSPGVTISAVDYDQRRSRVLMDLGPHQAVIVDRLRGSLDRILPKLGHESFPIGHVEAQITASNHGDYFRWHTDNAEHGNDEVIGREITFVYFFHREPKQFRGGELRIYDSRWENDTYVPMANYRCVVPEQNQIVVFDSSLAHEITPVECPSRAFADSRFTVNGWLHR